MKGCISPITLKDPLIKGLRNTFPCGKCKYCKERRRSQWSFRLHQELKHSATAYVYTLTYEDLHLPLQESPPLSGMYEPVLRKDHIQQFISKLRKQKERNAKTRTRYTDHSWSLPLRS